MALDNILKRKLIKSFLPTLKEGLPFLDNKLKEHLAAQQLHNGETQIIVMIYEFSDKMYLSIAAVNDAHTVTRQIQVMPLDKFINSLIEQI